MTDVDFSFSKQMRLLDGKDFQVVFDCPSKKIHSEHLLLIVCGNSLTHPRLGLAITKKKLKRAVDRNHLKRLTREYFRLKQHDFGSVDVVLIVKRGYERCYRPRISDELMQMFDKLAVFYPNKNKVWVCNETPD